MAYRFKLGEPAQKGARRIAVEQIDRAEKTLKSAHGNGTAVHETRKCLKRIRALLRLVRPALGEAVYEAENRRLREIGAMLSQTRDAEVLVATLAKLDGGATPRERQAIQSLRKIVEENARAQNEATLRTRLKDVIPALAAARKSLSAIKLNTRGPAVLEQGLRKAYAKGRNRFERAYTELTDEAMHEWRKSVQDHWRHCTLLVRAWPELMTVRLESARELSQILGDDHDLSLLASFVRKLEGRTPTPAQKIVIEKLVEKNQNALRAMARPRGERLFLEGSTGHARRLGHLWKSAKRIKAAGPRPGPTGPLPAPAPRGAR